MKSSESFEKHRKTLRMLPEKFRATNLRVFGSVSRGTDGPQSDIDLLVDPMPGCTLFDLGGLQVALENVLNQKVDLLTPAELPPEFRQHILETAISA